MMAFKYQAAGLIMNSQRKRLEKMRYLKKY
jgi:hypothetical protein